MTAPIPAADLPSVSPGEFDSVVGVDESTGAARRFPTAQLPGASFTQLGAGAVARTMQDKAREAVTPLDFGALGDGLTDDVLALERAIAEADASGRVLDWLGLEYFVSRQIGSAAITLARMNWRANGATVTLDPAAAHQQAVIYYRLATGANHRLTGAGLSFNASLKANVGAFFRQNDNARTATFYAERLTGLNARRNVSFLNCNGILVRGGFRRVDLIQPVARNVALPTGTGTVGVVGAVGIGVARGGVGESFPEFINIERPEVEDVFSEDATYTNDMDGITVFGDADSATRIFNSFRITAPNITNAWGRDIKAQMSTGEVVGGFFKKTTAPTGGNNNPSIDFLDGPGIVEDCHWLVDGVLVNAALVHQQSPQFGSWRAGATDNCSATLVNGGAAHYFVANYPRQATYGMFRAKNVTVNGPLNNFANVLTPDNKTVLVGENVQCSALSSSFARVVATGGSAPYFATVRAAYCINTGTERPLVVARIAGVQASAYIDEVGCTGFGPKSTRYNLNDATMSGLQRLGRLHNPDNTLGGTMTMYSKSLAASEQWELPAHGYSNRVHMALVSMNRGAQTQAVVAIGGSSVVLLSGGTETAVAGTTDPGTGMLRVWSGTTGMIVKNGDTSARVVTVMLFG